MFNQQAYLMSLKQCNDMSTFSKKLLIILGVIEVILLLFDLLVFQNGEVFLFFLVIAILFFAACAGLLKLMEWLSE